MAKLGYSVKLMRELMGFARKNRAYWIVPLAVFLLVAAVVIATGQSTAPLLYTLF